MNEKFPKKELIEKKESKARLAQKLGISRSLLYYEHVQGRKDWELKQRIEEALHENPAYGHRRVAYELKMNKKRILRVMRLYGLKPYRRRGRKWRKVKTLRHYPNLLLTTTPSYEHHIWAADFTEMLFHGKKVYATTIIDLFTRKIVGVHVGARKGAQLTVQALASALLHNPRPAIFHSDNGKEYEAKAFVSILEECGSEISRSRPGSPWENGYQESFYDKFKVDLGDPSRFGTFGELVAEIYQTTWKYNHTRIHSALKMPPAVYARKIAA